MNYKLGYKGLVDVLSKAYGQIKESQDVEDDSYALKASFLQAYDASSLCGLLSAASQLPDSTVVLIDPKLLK